MSVPVPQQGSAAAEINPGTSQECASGLGQETTMRWGVLGGQRPGGLSRGLNHFLELPRAALGFLVGKLGFSRTLPGIQPLKPQLSWVTPHCAHAGKSLLGDLL